MSPPGHLINGNMLAAPGFELGSRPPGHAGFMFPAMLAELQRRYLDVMDEHGWTTLQFSPAGNYGGITYEYRDRPEAFRDLLLSLKARGKAPLVMCLTDDQITGQPWTVDAAKRYLDEHLPIWIEGAAELAFAWEPDDVEVLRDEYVQLVLLRHIHEIKEGTGHSDLRTWWHGTPRHWGPDSTYLMSDGRVRHEAEFWDSQPWETHVDSHDGVRWIDGGVAETCDGCLWQWPHDWPYEGYPDRGEWGLEKTLYTSQIHGTGPERGIAGRLVELYGRLIVLDEFRRTWPAWQEFRTRALAHPRAYLLSGTN